MARWEESAVTRQGEDMLNDLLFGRRLTVTGAWGGTGETDPADLAALENLAGDRHRLALLDVENALEGKTFGVQIGNQDVETGFVLHQIGIFARVDDGPERLLCVFQDRNGKDKRGGIDVPSQGESPSFLLEFYGFLAITNGVKFEVDLSQSGAVATPQYLAQVMANHDQCGSAHPAIWAAIRGLQGTIEEAGLPETGEAPPQADKPGKPGQHYFDQAGQSEYICVGREEAGRYIWVRVGSWALGKALEALAAHNDSPESHPALREAEDALDRRLALLELMFNTDISGNPFTATFESLAGLDVKGIWNQPLRHLEF